MPPRFPSRSRGWLRSAALLIYSMGVSVDGFIADREGAFAWTVPDEELFRFHLAQVRELGGYLCGRKLYEMMLAWETDPSLRDTELDAAFAESGARSEGRLQPHARQRPGRCSARRGVGGGGGRRRARRD